MTKHPYALRRIFCIATAVAGLLWGFLLWLNPHGLQIRVFFEKGKMFFGDFISTRTCAEYGYFNEHQEALTACYPALGPTLSLPFPLTQTGGAWFTGVGMALWAVAFCLLLHRCAKDSCGIGVVERVMSSLLLVTGCLLSSIMLHAFEWGNQILYAAAAVTVFAAWHDESQTWKRISAAAALASAAVLKIVPAVLAFVYVAQWIRTGDRDARRLIVRDFCVFLVTGFVLFVVPFARYGGWDGFLQWCANAAANAQGYAHRGAWGAVPVGRTIRVLLHIDVSQAWTGLWAERCLSVALGLVCFAGAVRMAVKRMHGVADFLMMLVASMLLIPGNMHVYTGLYLLPVTALRLHGGMSVAEAVCWFAILCPLQIPLGAGCLNHPVANAAFLFLTLQTLVRIGRPAIANHQSSEIDHENLDCQSVR